MGNVRLSHCVLFALCVSIFVNRSTCSDRIDSSDNHAKVLILGAGATGIKAAQVFHDNNMDDFIIIEGADYVGGRVKNEMFAGVSVELGAQWVAPGNTEIVDLALNKWKLKTFPMDWDSVVLRDPKVGQPVPDEDADPSWEKLDEAIETANDIAEDIVSNNKPDMSCKSALKIAGWNAQSPLQKIIEWYSYDFENGQGSDVTSLLSVAFTDIESDIYIVIDERGYSSIFDEIAPFLKTPMFLDHTRLNQRVTRIQYDNAANLVVVHCADGTIYTGEYALVTFSIGVLQNDLVEFDPKLPDWKTEELKQMTMSAYGTIYMRFPEKFWDDEQHLLHVSNRYNFYPYFINFDEFGHLPNDTHILVAHVLDDDAWRIEYQSEEETKAEIETVLQQMYGLDSPPRATDFRVNTDWLLNPFTMGAYSNVPPEISQDCFLKLQARVGKLFFGGEATDELYNGYVIAGLRSGEREANKIIDCMAEGKECPEYVPPNPKCDCNMATSIVAYPIAVLMMAIVNFFIKGLA